MRPSISVTLDPGTERGVPWGRDLYTFVTSAAGHMMRTLQKPRKNRPSKRQVNHRRFLHNMIQRKFADIEAANHRLVSALHTEEENKSTSEPSESPQTLHQSGGFLQAPDECSAHGLPETRSNASVGSNEAEISEEKRSDTGNPKQHPTTNQSKQVEKKQSASLSLLSSKSSPKSRDHHHGSEVLDDKGQEVHNLSEDSPTTQQDCGFIQNVDMSPSFSPELCPLSLDSCDFAIQMFTDISTGSQAEKSMADMSESQWADIMDLFSVGGRDLGSSLDMEAYFDSICACQSDAGQEVGADENAGEYRYQNGCCVNQELPMNDFQSDQRSFQRQNEDAAETQLNKPNQDTDEPPSLSYDYNPPQLQTYQRPQDNNPHLLANCEKSQHVTLFEGIAQSFSVPLHCPEHCPTPVLPQDDDWLFTDILKDKKSPDSSGNISYY